MVGPSGPASRPWSCWPGSTAAHRLGHDRRRRDDRASVGRAAGPGRAHTQGIMCSLARLRDDLALGSATSPPTTGCSAAWTRWTPSAGSRRSPVAWIRESGQEDWRCRRHSRGKVALARLVLADPHTLVLDEATSLIDPRSAPTSSGRWPPCWRVGPAIAIAHRLFTAHDADQVAVVEDGQISEIGAHDQLIAADGSYARCGGPGTARKRTPPTRLRPADPPPMPADPPPATHAAECARPATPSKPPRISPMRLTA